jgi:hypothetical protein
MAAARREGLVVEVVERGADVLAQVMSPSEPALEMRQVFLRDGDICRAHDPPALAKGAMIKSSPALRSTLSLMKPLPSSRSHTTATGW